MSNKVLFNGLQYAPDGAGISRYTEHLVKGYLAAGYEVDILLRDDYKALYKQYDNVLFAGRDIHSSGQRIITEQWQMGKLYRQYDLIHFPDYATPILTNKLLVASIHDLSMKTMRQQRTWKQNAVKNVLLQNTVHRASGVVCDSYFTQNELAQYYPALAKKSQVIHLGISAPEQTELDEKQLQKWQLQEKQYLLYVGTLAPHKNVVSLVRAFALLCAKGYTGKLVLAGGKGWMYNDIFEEIDRLNLQEQVICTGYVSQQELETLYHYAACFVMLSLYEGFGLPPLEAMIRGITVIVSDIPVFHETVANCGFYVDPQNIELIAQQIELLLQDESLRKQLSVKGYARAQQFSWERTARETWQFYQNLL